MKTSRRNLANAAAKNERRAEGPKLGKYALKQAALRQREAKDDKQ